MSLTLCFPQKLQARAAVSSELLNSCSISPRILINIEQPPAILVKNRPQGKNLKIKSGWKPLGISYFSNDVDVELSWEKFRSSSTQCIKVSEIKISIGAEPPQIWIAQETEKNKCLKEQVLRHELNHVSNRHKFYNHLRENLHYRLLQLGSDEVFEIITSPAHQSPDIRKEIQTEGYPSELRDELLMDHENPHTGALLQYLDRSSSI